MDNRDVLFRPIHVWRGDPTPVPARDQWGRRWTTDLNKIVNALAKEASALGSRSLMIETDHFPSDYGVSGRPLANAVPKSHRVQVWLDIRSQAVCMPSQRHARWMDNLKAIQLTLERQRLVRSYGVISIDQQMLPFLRGLPPARAEAGLGGGQGPGQEWRSRLDAATALCVAAGLRPEHAPKVASDLEARKEARNMAAKAARHGQPDADDGVMRVVNSAWEYLERNP